MPPMPPAPFGSVSSAGPPADSPSVVLVGLGVSSCGRFITWRREVTDGSSEQEEEEPIRKTHRSISECYFAVKGTALVLPHDECMHVYRRSNNNVVAGDIRAHLQSMLFLLRREDTLKMAVKLESMHSSRTRYLVVVSCTNQVGNEESCLLGIDCNNRTTIGLVLPVWADTSITLDGDGGFSVSSSSGHFIFKPVSVQAMWSALQSLHKASAKAREYNYFQGGSTHLWIHHYAERIDSEQSCLNEWHAMDDLVSRRPPSPDQDRSKPTEKESTECLIRNKLKELMMSVDLDEVTSKYIRTRLEEQLDMNLNEFKPFIDQEMLTILGQMDAPTEILEYLYLGSEWNASNLEELKDKGVGYILNVTREIDNFYPGLFDYYNVRVYDDESTEMLKHWDKTYKYISRARDQGSKVLVHCKMGISRSASVVIAYVMKAYNLNLDQALDLVKAKRNCIKPNSGFIRQLEIYQGILDASKQRHNSIWRSKSETNLKSPDKQRKSKKQDDNDDSNFSSSNENSVHLLVPGIVSRPKSWSPDDAIADSFFGERRCPPKDATPHRKSPVERGKTARRQRCGTDPSCYQSLVVKPSNENTMPCIPKSPVQLAITETSPESPEGGLKRVASVKDRICELESQKNSTSAAKSTKPITKQETSSKCQDPACRSKLVLNLASQFGTAPKVSTPSPVEDTSVISPSANSAVPVEIDIRGVDPIISQTKPPAPKHHAVITKQAPTWLIGSGDSDSKDMASSLTSGEPELVSECAKRESAEVCSPVSKEPLALPVGIVKKQKEDYEVKTTLTDAPSRFIGNKSPPLPVKRDDVQYQSRITSHSCKETFSKECGSSASPTLKPDNTFTWASVMSSSTKLHVISKEEFLPNRPETLQIAKAIELGAKSEHLQMDANGNLSRRPMNPVSKDDISESAPEKEVTPGLVRKTTQQLEEKNLVRTVSFDGAFQSRSMPSTPPEVLSKSEHSPGKPILRSQSLRSEHRPRSLVSSKWVPLPALAPLGAPQPFKSPPREKESPTEHKEMSHSVSTPSVVEAVNEVLSGTSQVISSAIQSLPSYKRISAPPSCLSSVLGSEFGSSHSLPEAPPRPLSPTPGNPTDQDCSASEVPQAGIVRQQKAVLESLQPVLTTVKPGKKSPADELKTKQEQFKYIKELGNSLVPSESSTDVDEDGVGVVKRLTKEIEAKSSSSKSKKERVVIVGRDGKEVKNSGCKSEEKSFSSKSSSTPSSPVIESHPRLQPQVMDDVSTHLEGLFKKRTYSESTADLKKQEPPPTPNRKASLDSESIRKATARNNLSCLLGQQKGALAVGKRLAVSSVSPSSQLSDVKAPVVTSQETILASCTTGRPPASGVKSSICFPMSPPTPGGPQRKVRKQQGKTHPLSKLTARQRHANPLYNTM